ncbi:hypothetical protein AUJ16_03605 [Candidatus Micrarchaeota archaeon CG1_02_60_51]|nr:MAG: hypothetical protein AUJ16_03605 [Candidatus Micrarchaeota archaeon CG1_02_60_51]
MPADLNVVIQEEDAVEGDEPRAETALTQQARTTLPLEKVVEAALFIANRELDAKKLGKMLDEKPARILEAFKRIASDYEKRGGPIQLAIKEDSAVFQMRPEYVNAVGALSKESNLSKKATRILALIAKKGSILQSSLPKYFKGEIYAYTTELKEAGYVESKKYKNTRLLLPTKKFYEHFQFS